MQRTGHNHLKKTTTREIKHLCEKIAIEFRPEKIILFGSHAYGKPQWDSDVDLLIIMRFKGRPHRLAVNIRSRIEAPMALDLLVRTPQQISRRLAMGDSFIREILERGKVVYEANHEWITKAEADWNCAGLLFRARKHPNYDGTFTLSNAPRST